LNCNQFVIFLSFSNTYLLLTSDQSNVSKALAWLMLSPFEKEQMIMLSKKLAAIISGLALMGTVSAFAQDNMAAPPAGAPAENMAAPSAGAPAENMAAPPAQKQAPAKKTTKKHTTRKHAAKKSTRKTHARKAAKSAKKASKEAAKASSEAKKAAQ
jgi:hypothetical protein